MRSEKADGAPKNRGYRMGAPTVSIYEHPKPAVERFDTGRGYVDVKVEGTYAPEDLIPLATRLLRIANESAGTDDLDAAVGILDKALRVHRFGNGRGYVLVIGDDGYVLVHQRKEATP
jgi:hypothetical protein